MSGNRHTRPFIEAFERAFTDLYAQHDGLHVNVLYTFTMSALESDHSIFDIDEAVLARGDLQAAREPRPPRLELV